MSKHCVKLMKKIRHLAPSLHRWLKEVPTGNTAGRKHEGPVLVCKDGNRIGVAVGGNYRSFQDARKTHWIALGLRDVTRPPDDWLKRYAYELLAVELKHEDAKIRAKHSPSRLRYGPVPLTQIAYYLVSHGGEDVEQTESWAALQALAQMGDEPTQEVYF